MSLEHVLAVQVINFLVEVVLDLRLKGFYKLRSDFFRTDIF
jgi:hypothetical protein